MAKAISKVSQISLNGTVVGHLLGWSYSRTDGQVDLTDFDSTIREYEAVGLVDSDYTASAHFDLADAGQDEIESALGSTEVTLVIYPEGNTTGKPSLTVSVLVSTSNVDASGGLESGITAEFGGKFTSTLVEGTVSA